MSGINDLIERRIEAERKLIAVQMKAWAERRTGPVRSVVEKWAGNIERGEYKKGSGE